MLKLLKNNPFAMFALLVSFASAFFSIKSYRDTATQQVIDDTYKTFYEISITGLNNSDLLHLSTIPENYNMVEAEIHQSLMPITEKKRAEYLLKERAFANYLFGFYENTLFQYNESLKSRNKDRTGFLKKTLDYFRNKVLRNPRLLYLWDSHGGRLSINYAESTIEDYDSYVLNNKDSSLVLSIDSVGPYYIDTLKVSRSAK